MARAAGPTGVGAGVVGWMVSAILVLGFLAGIAFGTILGRPSLRIPRTAAVQGAIGIAAIAIVAATWYLASP